MTESFNVFWYESDYGPPHSELAPLALAVDGIVTPSRNETATFYVDPTTIPSPLASETLRSPVPSNLANIVTAGEPVPRFFSSLDNIEYWHKQQAQPSHGDADGESVMIDFGRWRDAQYRLEFFVEHANFNSAPLIGEHPLPALDLFPSPTDSERARASLNQWLLVLSVSSISISLPSISALNLDHIEEMRLRSADERAEYLTYLRELLYEGRTFLLSDPSLEELEKWANFVSRTKILPSVQKLERSVEHMLSRNLTERIGTALLEKSSSFVASLGKENSSTSIFSEVALEVLATVAPKVFATLVERRELQKSLGLGYLYRLRKQAQ